MMLSKVPDRKLKQRVVVAEAMNFLIILIITIEPEEGRSRSPSHHGKGSGKNAGGPQWRRRRLRLRDMIYPRSTVASGHQDPSKCRQSQVHRWLQAIIGNACGGSCVCSCLARNGGRIAIVVPV